jgi:hypothetical protein
VKYNFDPDRLGNFKGFLSGHGIAILGNGPSILDIVAEHDLSYLQVLSLGVNRSWKLKASAYHIVADLEHLHEYYKDLWDAMYVFTWRDPRNEEFDPVRSNAKDEKLVWCRSDYPEWSVMPKERGKNCLWSNFAGTAAVELAIWLGANPIWLLGYDLHEGEGKFYHEEEPEDGYGAYNAKQLEAFDLIAPHIPKGVEIFNCNPDSALKHFPYRDVKEIMLI